jgi:hypothetical protein
LKTKLKNRKTSSEKQTKLRTKQQEVRKQKTIETMKTRMNQIVVAALFGLIMLVGNVSAKGTEVTASSRETIIEPAMEVESWMVSEKTWGSISGLFRGNDLQLENWMVDENTWSTSDFRFTETTDESLELESWMIDGKNWQVNSPAPSENEQEADLAVESWMLNESIWN